AALAGVMGETAPLGAGIERAHRVGAERAKTHRRDIEHRSRIRLGAIRAADGDAEFSTGARLRRHRMVYPFVAVLVDVLLGAERADRQDDEAWRERKQQRFHVTPRAIPPNCYCMIKRPELPDTI